MRDTAGASSSSTTQPRRSSRIRPTSAPRTTSPAASAERLDQLVDTYGDVVADRTDFVDWLSLRVGQLPVHVALPGDVRARVVARCDHDVGPLDKVPVEKLRYVVGRVDADLVERAQDVAVHGRPRCAPGRSRGVR